MTKTNLKELSDEELRRALSDAARIIDRGSVGSRTGKRQAHKWLESLEKEKARRLTSVSATGEKA